MRTNSIQTTSINDNWASSVSDYILQRRQQTLTAYCDARRSQDNKTAENALFRSLFIILAEQLEEGHTVLTVTANPSDNLISIPVDQSVISFFPWQYELVEILASPLLELFVEDAEQNQDSKAVALSNIAAKNAPLWLESNLANKGHKPLLERLHLIREIIQLFQNCLSENYVKSDNTSTLNEATCASINSLSKFINYLSKHALFSQLSHNLNATHTLDRNTLATEINENSLSNIIHLENAPTYQRAIIYETFKGSKAITATKPCDDSSSTITFWLHRTWQAEYNLAVNIQNIMQQRINPLDINTSDSLNTQQEKAIKVANENAFSIITGGPGTGKTYTVAQLVMALHQTEDEMYSEEVAEGAGIRFSTDSARLALAAPTGKAAQRMQESLQAALDHAQIDMQLQEAKTIHRLLGINRDGRPRYHADNPLGEDIVIVDEASMLGVELANYLVSAIKPGARLILLGDANQLAAVDAGSVLADLCRISMLQPINVELKESRRFGEDSGIGKLASEINNPSVKLRNIWQLLKKDRALEFQAVNRQEYESDTKTGLNNHEDSQSYKLKNSLSNEEILNNLTRKYTPYISKISKLLEYPIAKSTPEHVRDTISDLMTLFNQFRILTAGHHGEWGDHSINDYLTNWHVTKLKLPLGKSQWFHGRPVMVLQNNYELGLFNGDIGICLQTVGVGNQLEVFFENKTQGIAVNLLNEVFITTAYAMTIHKSQGSEFNHVAIAFDSSHSRLLSKELIYTAVTRAKQHVSIYSTKTALERAVQTPTQRHTGLALQFES